MSKRGMKLGYGNYNNIERAINKGLIDERDIVITDDTSELVYIRDDLTRQLVRPRVRRFQNISAAIIELNSTSDTYAGDVVMILNESGEYEPYIVQSDGDGFEVQPFPSVQNGSSIKWVEF